MGLKYCTSKPKRGIGTISGGVKTQYIVDIVLSQITCLEKKPEHMYLRGFYGNNEILGREKRLVVTINS